MFAEIQRLSGSAEADGYLRLRAWLTELYQTEFDGFIGANFDSPLSLVTRSWPGWRRWEGSGAGTR